MYVCVHAHFMRNSKVNCTHRSHKLENAFESSSTNFSIYDITLKFRAIFLDSAIEFLTWLLNGKSTKCWNKSASILLSAPMVELNYATF